MNEDLRTWFRQKWVRMDTKGEIKGPCAREDGEGKPKCLPAAKARSMSKQDRATAARRKRREDPVADRKGKGNKPIMVNTEEFIPEGNEPTNPSLWSRAKALAKKKFDVYPSAYANGWAAKYYKSKGGGWRSVSEATLKSNKDGNSGSRGTTFSSSAPNSYHVIGSNGEHLGTAMNMKDPKYGGRTTHWHVTWHKKEHKDHPTSFQYMHQLKKHVKELGEEVSLEEACWKGYKRVGMKKKGDRMVPNCVPEAREIIEKAKAKLKKDPLTGAKIDKDRFILPEEQMEEGWVVKKGTEVVSTHKTKDEADVKAMKHPLYKVYAKEEVELEEAYGMWKVDFPKQHAGKAVAAGSVHVKAQNSAHAHKVAAKRVGVDHKMFKSKVTKSSILPENNDDLPWEEDPKNPSRKVGVRKDEYGNKIKNVAKHLAKKAMKANEDVELDENYATRNDGKGAAWFDKFRGGGHNIKRQRLAKERYKKTGVLPGSKTSTDDAVASYLAKNKVKKFDSRGNVKEELGKDNEWGRPELRKKFAAMTPGQEGLAADKIPTFDPRYDDVTTQHLGLHPMKEGYLAEISARGAEARAKFQAKIQKTLNDPSKIAKAKKALAKKAKIEKDKEPAHLVMQLRKAVSIGSKVHFRDGSHHAIAPNHADRFMSKYNSAKSAIEKEALQKRAHASHSEFMKTIAEEVHENCGTPDCCMQCDTAPMGTHHVDSYEAHRGSGDQISPVISHDDEDIRFSDFDETEFEKELEADVLALGWEDLVDLYDDDELEYVEDGEEEDEDEDEGEDMQEAITPAGRLKKKFAAMRTKTRRNMARNLSLKRVSTPERIKSRSIRAARRMVYKRLLRNRDISTVSAAEKTRLEAQVKRMAPMVARLSVRIMPKVRKLEQSRIKNARARKK